MTQFFTKLVLGMSAETYHADPVPISLSSSIAHLMVNECPALAYHRHPKLGGAKQEETESTDRGNLVHELLLGTGKGIVEVDAKDWRTKAAKEQREQARAAGKVAVLKEKRRYLDIAVTALQEQFTELGVSFEGSHREAVLFWTETADDGTEVQCRGMVDGIWPNAYRILDLKTCDTAHPKTCERKCIDFGYDIQHAAYTSALRKIWPEGAGRERMGFVFAECDAPYLVTDAELDGTLRERGERLWRRAVNRWAECLKSDCWPGYVTGKAYLSAPPWAVEEA